MWAFLASDCMFFGSLIATYLVYRGHSTSHPLPEDIFDIPLTSTSSFVLLLSSWLMVLALSAVQKGNLWQFRLWTLGVAFFGSIFLGFQVYEFTHFVHAGLTLKQNLFGTTFFVLTGTHGCHVAIGVLWLMSLFFYSFIGGVTKERALDVEIAGLYWHFVDIVWILIFAAVYLLEYII
ncbi:cytochrome c oxidase subunit 3 [bacterium]|nr:cytochrome c oxidase subunit 3 [bacterium]